MTMRAGDAAGTVLLPRSEILCRLHRPYEERVEKEAFNK
jgi:hypothetical protein